jgi:hypothetical protein
LTLVHSKKSSRIGFIAFYTYMSPQAATWTQEALKRLALALSFISIEMNGPPIK